ncbi:Hypothetical predicted protein [Pelobates cultripes]|uniref:Uncharacterized protein n=1 Tax=Pelobates cultripes TaxID=61616 RepID=A0AAD1RBF8_PELCU|nr:Hypothetical predicted protein [Pelobates cultripes]
MCSCCLNPSCSRLKRPPTQPPSAAERAMEVERPEEAVGPFVASPDKNIRGRQKESDRGSRGAETEPEKSREVSAARAQATNGMAVGKWEAAVSSERLASDTETVQRANKIHGQPATIDLPGFTSYLAQEKLQGPSAAIELIWDMLQSIREDLKQNIVTIGSKVSALENKNLNELADYLKAVMWSVCPNLSADDLRIDCIHRLLKPSSALLDAPKDDFSPMTMQRRREFDPFMVELCKLDIRYRCEDTLPSGQKTICLHKPEEGMEVIHTLRGSDHETPLPISRSPSTPLPPLPPRKIR